MSDYSKNNSYENEIEPESKDFQDRIIIDPPIFELHVTPDNMNANIKIFLNSKDQVVTPEDIYAFLEQNKISYGILVNEIEQYCNNKNFEIMLLAARGISPIRGTDAVIINHFEQDRELIPKESTNGKVDFYDLDYVQNVKKNETLCTKKFATNGSDGINIYNQIVRAVNGIDRNFLSGENTIISEDKSKLLAAIDGCLEITNSRISVKNVLTIKGDVDNTCGNINALGSVVITGDVREGFSVNAKGDISIRGMVEGAVIEAGGKVSISDGMNGMNKGKIFSGGDLYCKFIENAAEISCNSNITSEVIINSTAKAKGSIILKGKNACLKGGFYQAGTMIYAKEIGNQKNTPTTVSIDSDELSSILGNGINDDAHDTEEIRALKNQLKSINRELNILENAIQNLLTNGNLNEKKDILKSMLLKKNELNININEITETIAQIKADIVPLDLSQFKIVALGVAYPGTKIMIANYVLNCKQEYTYTKFFIDKGSIHTEILNPGDKII